MSVPANGRSDRQRPASRTVLRIRAISNPSASPFPHKRYGARDYAPHTTRAVPSLRTGPTDVYIDAQQRRDCAVSAREAGYSWAPAAQVCEGDGFACWAWEPWALRARALTNLNMVAKASGPESVLMEGTESET